MDQLELVRPDAKLLGSVIALKDIKFDNFTYDEFVDFLMSFPDTQRRIQVIKGIVTKNIRIRPRLVCPIT